MRPGASGPIGPSASSGEPMRSQKEHLRPFGYSCMRTFGRTQWGRSSGGGICKESRFLQLLPVPTVERWPSPSSQPARCPGAAACPAAAAAGFSSCGAPAAAAPGLTSSAQFGCSLVNAGYEARPRAGHWPDPWGRTLITRVGKLELRVPQDRDGRFSTELFERYQRSERALVAALAEMYVQGVSTGKVKAIRGAVRAQLFRILHQCHQREAG